MSALVWEQDPFDAPPDPVPPPGGWTLATCRVETHRWHLDLDDGSFHITCMDPCEGHFDPSAPQPVCRHDFEPHDFTTPDPLAITLTYVDDSTASTPAGPAEYGFYIEVRSA